jgi:1-acyl-sn-glycerol-3-phosphate acyltransferase
MFRALSKSVLRALAKLLFRVRITGIKPDFTAQRQLIIANHESFLDGLLLGLFLPPTISGFALCCHWWITSRLIPPIRWR